jgi:hypothetical protein
VDALVNRNQCASRVTVRQVAVGRSPGRTGFHTSPDGIVSIGEDGSGLDDVGDLQVVSLDDEIDSLGVVPELVKIDVEGFEYEVLAGARRLLRERKPAISNGTAPRFARAARAVRGAGRRRAQVARLPLPFVPGTPTLGLSDLQLDARGPPVRGGLLRMRILLVGDYPRDPRLGSKVLMKLQEEFRSQGHACDLLLADDLGQSPRHRALRWALEPLAALAAVSRAFRERGPYDVVDIASAEGLWVGALRRMGLFNRAAVIARSNGIEHLNYRRMIDDHNAGLMAKPWIRRLWYPALRLTQVAAAARAADRLIVLNEADRLFAVSLHWKHESAIDLVPHGVSARFLVDVPPTHHPRGGASLRHVGLHEGHSLSGRRVLAAGRARPPREPHDSWRRDALETIRSSFSGARLRDDSRPLAGSGCHAAYRSHDPLVFPSSYEDSGWSCWKR